jgi:Icc-related predicted phosphoesterase
MCPADGMERKTEIRRLPVRPAGPMRFAAVGDPQSGRQWAEVAAAIQQAGPDFVVIAGDLVGHGREESVWQKTFWAPAKSLLATVPTYAVPGNHDHNAPIFREMLYSPEGDGRAANWSQEIGDVTLVGIDGEQSFAPDSTNSAWLSETLAAARGKFLFLCTHYPPYASAWHGEITAEGLPREWQMRQSRQVILPMLREHRATAMLTGHEHCYERNEPPGGVTHITTGGGGGVRRAKSPDAHIQNPYSVVFANTLHYCLFEISGDRCSVKAIALDGSILDSREWDARHSTPIGG